MQGVFRQNSNSKKVLFGNVVISGLIECLTGIHIGGMENSIQIGGIDKPVIRNPITGKPYIPGSSLKGKMRSIVEKAAVDENKKQVILPLNRCGDTRSNKIFRHECEDISMARVCHVCRIFGSTGIDDKNSSLPSNILVRDGELYNEDKMKIDGLYVLEAKTENTLDRITSAATPRTFERVPAGAKFWFEIIYRVEAFDESGNEPKVDFDKVRTDLRNIINSMNLIEIDGLGGKISRGYGRVAFKVGRFEYVGIEGKETEKLLTPYIVSNFVFGDSERKFDEKSLKPIGECAGFLENLSISK